jgi:hypothetical protein
MKTWAWVLAGVVVFYLFTQRTNRGATGSW